MKFLEPEEVLTKIGIIAIGERYRDGYPEELIKKNGEPFIISDCRLCDEPVWCTTWGRPGGSHSEPQYALRKGTKSVHKDCIMFLGAASIKSMTKSLKARGLI